MQKVDYNISVPYKADKLFDLVADIESYPLFLPWCSAARIIKRENNVIIAELAIRYKIFFGTYTSKVTLIPKSEINVELVDGPFQHLKNQWNFIQNNQQSDIFFTIDFKLKSNFLNDLLEKSISNHTNTIFEAFIKRAEIILPLKEY